MKFEVISGGRSIPSADALLFQQARKKIDLIQRIIGEYNVIRQALEDRGYGIREGSQIDDVNPVPFLSLDGNMCMRIDSGADLDPWEAAGPRKMSRYERRKRAAAL